MKTTKSIAIDSLIPIKGVSRVMRAVLRDNNIFDAPTLIARGKSKSNREALATKLKVNEKLVSSWVAQVNLWKIEGMTADMAYLLVLAGVCDVSHLSKVDIEKLYPILESLSYVQPDFTCLTQEETRKLIVSATTLYNEMKYLAVDNNDFEEPVHLYIENDGSGDGVSVASVLKQNDLDIDVDFELPLPNVISGTLYIKSEDEDESDKKYFTNALVEIDGIVDPSQDKASVDDLPFAYSEADGRFYITMPERYSMSERITINVSKWGCTQKFVKTPAEIIDLIPERKILNRFKYVDSVNDELRSLIEQRDATVKANIASAAKVEKPTLTDAQKKQLASMVSDLQKNKKLVSTSRQATLNVKNNVIVSNKIEDEQLVAALTSEQKALINEEIDRLYSLSVKRINLLEEFGDVLSKDGPEYIPVISKDNEGESLEKLLIMKFSSTNLRNAFTRFTDECVMLESRLNNGAKNYFLISEEVFRGLDLNDKKALPNVRLMGDGEKTVHLSTDTANSKSYKYKMLQRLIAPKISKRQDNGKFIEVDRKSLDAPIDVMEFRETLSKDAGAYPQMSTLGIGYVLNMNQAWIPDGFSLGNLLYSLVLAPGEEQRVIVRENEQEYTVKDTSTGSDSVSEDYALSQGDSADVAYNNAVDRLSVGSSSQQYKTSSFSIGASASYGGLFGLSAGYSSSKGSASAKSRQSDSHNEASAMAQNFQHSIKSESDRLSQAQRVSIRAASSSTTESVATKIIANHNHSHAMTIQYWEVMRRYRMETSIDNIDLVVFVPLNLIRFLPDGNELQLSDSLSNGDLTIDIFNKRYKNILFYANLLENNLPYRYRSSLNTLRKFTALPNWKIQKVTDSENIIVSLDFTANILPCDNISIKMRLRNGTSISANSINYTLDQDFGRRLTSRKEVEDDLRKRGNTGPSTSVSCLFNLPSSFVHDDIDSIVINRNLSDFTHTLSMSPSFLNKVEYEAYTNMLYHFNDWAKDLDGGKEDQKRIRHYLAQLPEAFKNFPETTNVTISESTIRDLYEPKISGVTVSISNIENGDVNVSIMNESLKYSARITVGFTTPTLRYSEAQAIESLLQHVVSESMLYSQIIWASLSSDERVMMLDKYTIGFDLGDNQQAISTHDNFENCTIPLLDCVNVKNLLGFYGNCMVLPLTYPQTLAKALGRTSAEIQEELYRYHVNNFRAPSTVISLPTDGMVGEAVLGETNVSEEIDITRFWNWQDSPIEKMELNNDYLTATDYLANKNASSISALNLQGVTQPTAVTPTDLANALLSKQIQDFTNITGLEQVKDILNNATNTTAQGRDKVVDSTSGMINTAVDAAADVAIAQFTGKNPRETEKKADTTDKTANKEGDKTNDKTTSSDTSDKNVSSTPSKKPTNDESKSENTTSKVDDKVNNSTESTASENKTNNNTNSSSSGSVGTSKDSATNKDNTSTSTEPKTEKAEKKTETKPKTEKEEKTESKPAIEEKSIVLPFDSGIHYTKEGVDPAPGWAVAAATLLEYNEGYTTVEYSVDSSKYMADLFVKLDPTIEAGDERYSDIFTLWEMDGQKYIQEFVNTLDFIIFEKYYTDLFGFRSLHKLANPQALFDLLSQRGPIVTFITNSDDDYMLKVFVIHAVHISEKNSRVVGYLIKDNNQQYSIDLDEFFEIHNKIADGIGDEYATLFFM